MSGYAPGVKLIQASLDPEFVKRIRANVNNPEIHENGMLAEACGSSEYDSNYTIFHDPRSADNPDAHGFQRGGLETSSEGTNQYCHPAKNSARILWHTHPRNTPAYPSGSDIFVVVVRDCSGRGGEDSTAQSLIEFLFTEHGFWIIHRGVDGENRIARGLNIHGQGQRSKMREIDRNIAFLEDNVIRPCYMRNRVPSRDSAQSIFKACGDLIKESTVHISFYTWDEADSFEIPVALFYPEVSDVCPSV